MKTQLLKRLSNSLAPPVLALLVSLLGVGVAQAITPAGTTITNSASVDYEDSVGNPFTAISEDATVDVGTVYAATIESDRLAVTAAPSTTKNVSFTLTNNANTADTFTITFGNDNGAGTPEGDSVNGAGGSDLDTTYTAFVDANQNGVADGGETPITSGSTIVVPRNDGSVNGFGFPTNIAPIVVQAVISGAAVNNDEIGLILTATSGNTTVQDITGDTAGVLGNLADRSGGTPGQGYDNLNETVQALITVSGDAVLELTKSATVSGNRITYTLEVSNNGAAIARNVRIVDQIPVNTTFAEIEQVNLSTAAGDRFYDSTAAAYARMTVGQDNPAAPFDIAGNPGNLVFFYDSDTDGTVETGGDDAVITPQTIVEPTGFDLNADGSTGTNFSGIEFLDANLPPTASVSIVYTVTINSGLAGGVDTIPNTFCVAADLDNNATNGALSDGYEAEGCSNTPIITVPAIYGVDADDTAGDGTPDSPAIGDDEDGLGVNNDIQHEESAASGATVRFNNVITNTGNVADDFDLSIGTGVENTFPVGTTFQFYTGASPNGGTIAGVAAGDSVTINVRATLPAVLTPGMATIGGSATVAYDEALNLYYIESGTDAAACIGGGVNDPNSDGCWDTADGADDTYDTADDEVFFAQLTATSANDPAGSPASDTKGESLGAVKAGAVDLANSSFLTGGSPLGIDTAVNEDAVTDVSDGIIDDGDGDSDKSLNQTTGLGMPAVGLDGGDAENDIADDSFTGQPGDTVVIPLYVANEQGATSTYAVSVDTTLTTVPTGWTVSFREPGGGTSIPGSTLVPTAEGTEYAFEAVVTIPSNVADAPAGVYDFAFKVVSNANSSITDLKIDRITVGAVCDINFPTGATDQVQQQGTVDYLHTITNNGNEPQTLDFTVALSDQGTGTNGLTGWTAKIRIDTDADGLVDEDFSNLVAGTGDGVDPDDGITVDQGGTLTVIETEDQGGNVAFTLQPGDSISFEVRVFAPSNADINDKVRATITANGGCEAVVINDDTTVALQVRIDKTVAVDPDCFCTGYDVAAPIPQSGDPGFPATPLTFQQNNTTAVQPGECLVWRLTVTNDGTQPAENVVIQDQITPFSVAVGSGVWGAANPSGVADPTGNPDFAAYGTCVSENLLGEACTDYGNIIDATAIDTSTGGTGAVSTVNVSGSSVSFNVGQTTLESTLSATTGGTLIGSDSAVGQFCVQVQ